MTKPTIISQNYTFRCAECRSVLKGSQEGLSNQIEVDLCPSCSAGTYQEGYRDGIRDTVHSIPEHLHKAWETLSDEALNLIERGLQDAAEGRVGPCEIQEEDQ